MPQLISETVLVVCWRPIFEVQTDKQFPGSQVFAAKLCNESSSVYDYMLGLRVMDRRTGVGYMHKQRDRNL